MSRRRCVGSCPTEMTDATVLIHQQVHGYKFGHELLAYNTRLERDDQDVVDRLSDLAGPLEPGEEFAPYLTCYPLPSGTAYVVGRTWQDLAAPRAGCVLTRSLIIPMLAWSEGSCLATTLAMLAHPPGKEIECELPVYAVDSHQSMLLPPLTGAPYLELAEALFLEQRRSIVVFDLPDAQTAAVRLLGAIWPGLRRTFSICTRACSPRHIAGKTFDLLFAPATSRVNFGRWEDRRIDGAALSYTVRHRWTEDIAARVFSAPIPYTLEAKTQDLFGADSGDESALRLSLLWTDLLRRSESSPFAVLGLLDIVDLLNKSHAVHEFPAVEAALERSLMLAADSYAASEFFDFILAFLGKFPKKLPAKKLLRRVRQLVAVAAADQAAAVEFLHRIDIKQSELPVILAAGLGDGLARHIEQNRLDLYDFRGEMALALIIYSRPFSRALVRSLESRRAQNELDALAKSLDTKNADIKARARRHLIPNITDALSLSVLKALLDGAPVATLLQATRSLWRANKLSLPEFDQVLLGNAASAGATLTMRAFLLDLPSSESADRMIVYSLSLNTESFDWIGEVSIPYSRKSQWVIDLLTNSSDGDLKRMPGGLADVVLNYVNDRTGSLGASEQAARIVILAAPSLRTVLTVAKRLVREVDRERACELASVVLSRLLKESSGVPAEVALYYLNNFAPLVQVRDLLLWVTPTSSPVDRLSDNLLLIVKADREVREQIQYRIDILTERIADRSGNILRADAIAAWASLIEGAGQINSVSQFQAASDALKYAFDRKQAQVSALVAASFPIVYAHIANDVETPSSLSLFSFLDWDRCQALRSELVDVYMRSHWPPQELVLIADRVGQLVEIVDNLLRRYKGSRYFENILARLDDLPPDIRETLEEIDVRRQRRFGI